MIVLGLHFGHDASVAVLRDGDVAAFVSRERRVGRKHAASLGLAEIDDALERSGLGAADIDLCTVTSTQEMELICPAADDIEIAYEGQVESLLNRGYVAAVLRGEFKAASDDLRYYQTLFADVREIQTFPTIDDFPVANSWPQVGLSALSRRRVSTSEMEVARLALHRPMTLTMRGRRFAGYFVDHHMAHAASTYYLSGYPDAAVITHDGYPKPTSNSGLFCFGTGAKLYPLASHLLTLGHLYTDVSMKLGLGDHFTGAGKLMGLAPYGRPTMFDPRFVGNDFDVAPRIGRVARQGESLIPAAWWEHCLERARIAGHSMDSLSDARRITEPLNADIAASTQKLLEEGMVEAARALQGMLAVSGIETPRLCLSGGTALNCPSNSHLYNAGPYRSMFVEPCCDDSGLSIGSALHVFHNVLERPLRARRAGHYFSPFIGRRPDLGEIEEALAARTDTLIFTPLAPEEFVAAAARDLADDRVIALFTGASEAGPRALCHRSVLAHPGTASNWQRVNAIKRREAWRPFAPVVLEDHAASWFGQVPIPAPYMLFTGQVLDDRIPAVTHVDRSSRVQTADSGSGPIYGILRHFLALTGLPVLLNTSLNGPGEPIVDSPEQALEFLSGTRLDALYIERFRVTRREG